MNLHIIVLFCCPLRTIVLEFAGEHCHLLVSFKLFLNHLYALAALAAPNTSGWE